jgi:outer membrane murein-binding lipoprotein Lpp
MKRFFKNLVFAVVLISILLSIAGCGSYERMGETNAELKRRHARMDRLRRHAMMEDLEALFLMDKHMSTTERTIP